ncbi:dimethylsulfonioproprionate lyase family protein [Melittangium boletus]|uniref:dimethylsulfonioproprionate lyase family protein n=1 Tax=Melittangium boletus TaxID=83453 RepID=UPI003DA5A437
MIHVDDQLPAYLLGTLEREARLTVEHHLARCETCSAALEGLRPATEALAASVTPVTPPAGLGARLFAYIRGEGRFADFVPELARLFDLDEASARALVAQLPQPDAWMEGPAPGVLLLPVAGGPRLEGAMAAFVKLAPGTLFPAHRHSGEEVNYVLQGGFREDSGHEVWPGERLDKTAESSHAYVALEGPDCIAASILWGVVEFAEGAS